MKKIFFFIYLFHCIYNDFMSKNCLKAFIFINFIKFNFYLLIFIIKFNLLLNIKIVNSYYIFFYYYYKEFKSIIVNRINF
jgi:hypothetical protein